MLKKLHRITKQKDFDNIFKKGRSAFNKIIGIKVINSDLSYSRFGIIVSNKISKKAVERNKIKRRIREVLKVELNKLNKNINCVVITLTPIKEVDFLKIKASIISHFKKLHLYK